MKKSSRLFTLFALLLIGVLWSTAAYAQPSPEPTDIILTPDTIPTTPEPVEVVIVDAGTGDPVTEVDTTPSWVSVVIVVLGAIVTALSTLLSAGAYAALRQSLKVGVQIAELLAKSTATTTDDEFIKRLKATLNTDALNAQDKPLDTRKGG